MARSDMSSLEWEFIEAVLPNKTRGKKRVDDRRGCCQTNSNQSPNGQ